MEQYLIHEQKKCFHANVQLSIIVRNQVTAKRLRHWKEKWKLTWASSVMESASSRMMTLKGGHGYPLQGEKCYLRENLFWSHNKLGNHRKEGRNIFESCRGNDHTQPTSYWIVCCIKQDIESPLPLGAINSDIRVYNISQDIKLSSLFRFRCKWNNS